MKKLTLSVLSLIFLLCAAVGLVGCGKEKHTHSFTEQKVEQQYLASAATCTEPAKYYYSCSCGEKGTETFASGNALGHSFTNYVSDNNATCTQDGTKTAICDRNDCSTKDTVSDKGSKLSHAYTKQVATDEYLKQAATCTEKAIYYYSCECGAKGAETFTYGNALGHKLGEWQTVGGKKIRICMRNGCKYSEAEDIQREASKGLEYTVNSDNATCTVAGIGTCTDTDVVIPEITDDGYKVTSIGFSAFSNCKELTSVIIPDSITFIDAYAFYGCSGLTNIIIPDSVNSIWNSAFDGCSGLTSITLPFIGRSRTAIDGYNQVFGYIFGFTQSHYSNTITGTTLQWVSSNGDYRYYHYHIPSSLKSVTLSNGVTSIGDSAFYGCSGLTNIIIPDSVTSIGRSAFYGCSGLTSVTIPDNVTSIGYSAFQGCMKLTSVTIPDGVTSISDSAFSGCKSLTSVTIPEGVTSINCYTFAYCSGLTSIVIPEGVISIGEKAFSDCSGLTSVTIPDSVTSIGDWAFYNCSGLTSVTIGNRVTSIGRCAFYKCNGLTTIRFNGTKAQWNAISKGSNWNYNTGKYTIYCTDGTISK